MLEQVVPAEPLEHALAHLVGGLDVERDPGDRADRAEADHEPVELGIATRRANQAAVRGDDLEGGDGRRQVAVGVPRPVSRGRHGAGNRDVRQRRQVCERQPLASELEREFAVAHGASARHGRGLVIHEHIRGDCRECHELGGVGDVGERVARAQDADLRRRRDDLPHLLERRRGVDRARPIGIVPGPVGGGPRVRGGAPQFSSARLTLASTSSTTSDTRWQIPTPGWVRNWLLRPRPPITNCAVGHAA